MWQCQQCGESCDDNFDVCWNCQTVKPGSLPAAQTPTSGSDQPGDEIICTTDGEIIAVPDEVPVAPRLAPDLGYRLALLCGLCGVGFVVGLFNFIGGQDRRGFQALVIQWGVVIWILALLVFLLDLVGLTGLSAVVVVLGTTLVFPIAALWVLRRVPWPAPPVPASLTTPVAAAKRGGCLTAFLMFGLTSNPFIVLLYLLIAPAIQRDFRQVAWLVPVSILGATVSFFLALAVWKWQKIGVFGYALSFIIGIIISLGGGLSIYSALLQLLGLVIFISLVRPVWKHFE